MKSYSIHPISCITDALPGDAPRETSFSQYNPETPVRLVKCEDCGLMVNYDSIDEHRRTHLEMRAATSQNEKFNFPNRSEIFSQNEAKDETTTCSYAKRRDYVINKLFA